MPFKLNQDRRPHIPKQKRKVTNSAAYDAAPRQRGSLTVWFTDDGCQVGPLLDQVASSMPSFTADGAYDQNSVSAAVAQHHPEAAIIVPPRSTAVPSETAETAPPLPFQPLRGREPRAAPPTQRDRHLQFIAEHGRMVWQKMSGHAIRARAEAAVDRFKQVIGDGRSRSRFRVRSTWNAGGGRARARTSVGPR